MSLIPSANNGSTTQPSFILNAGTVAGPVVNADDLAILGDSLGRGYIRAANGAASAQPGTLHLGANADVYDNIVLSSGPAATTVNTNLICGQGLAVAGASVFTNSIALNNQQIQDNLRYTQPFGPVADGTNDVPLGTPQPSPMAGGSYAIMVQVTGNPQIQPSCIGYWNGAQWSAGANGAAFTYPGGNVSVGIRPAVGGASLVMSNGSGAPISGFVYYVALGEN